jgi:hypothetical protein
MKKAKFIYNVKIFFNLVLYKVTYFIECNSKRIIFTQTNPAEKQTH